MVMTMESTTATLPIYIQKYIIKILCEHIDSINRQIISISLPQNSRLPILREYKQIRKDIESNSLVNKCWFNTFSQNLSVSVDFISYHYNCNLTNAQAYEMDNIHSHFIVKRLNSQITATTNNYRLLKDENIKELVLNIQDWGIYTRYDMPDELPHIEFVMDLLNKEIKSRFINLEKLIITNSSWYKYYQSFEFHNIEIGNYSTGSHLVLPPKNIKAIESLSMYLNSNIENKDSQCLKFFKSLNRIGSLYSSNNIDFKYLNDNGNGFYDCFTNTNTIYMENYKIQNLAYLLKLSPNVSECRIHICIDNLIYQLNSFGDGKIDINNSQNHQQCGCSNDDQNSSVNFKEHWQLISDSIMNNKNLKKLSITHNCINSLTPDDDDDIEDSEMFNTGLSTQLIDQLKLILSNNKSIVEFHLGNIPNYSIRINALDNFKK